MGDSRRFAFIAVGLAFVASCASPDTDASSLQLGRGATITRESIRMTVQSGDPGRRLIVSTGVEAAHVAAICTGGMQPGWRDPMELREIDTPNGGVVLHVEGDVHTLVYASDRDWMFTNDFGEFYEAFCDAVLTGAPIATGISHAVFSDSFGEQGDHWGFKAEGELEDAAGERVRFVHAGSCGIPDWETGTLRCNVQVNLH